MSDRYPVYQHIENYLPSFCWQSSFEILIMLEGVEPDIDYNSVKVALSRLSRGACPRVERMAIPKRINDRRHPNEMEYLYRFNPRFERLPSPRLGRRSHARIMRLVAAILPIATGPSRPPSRQPA